MSVRTEPKVFVITLNWDGRKWLGDCLSSILAMDYPNFEVVMVDNGSTDGSVQFVHETFPGVHVVETGSNLGYARGFNAGLEFAAQNGAKYFLIMNNDTVIDRNALTALIETMQNKPKAGFVTGKVYFYDRPNILQSVGKEEDPVVWSGNLIGFKEEDNGQYDEVAERTFIDDVFTLVSRSLYDEVGGYDPQYYLQSEEFDLQVRAKKKGWKFYYTPKAKIRHRVSMSMGGIGNPVGRYFDTRSGMVVMARHARFFKFARYYFYTGYKVTNSLLRGLAQLNMSKIKPRLTIWLGFVSGTLWLFHRRPAIGIPPLIRKLNK